MTLAVGWHLLPGGDDAGPPLPVATFLDLAPTRGMLSPERLVRPYFKGRPLPQEIAQKARAWHQQGCRVVLGNEPNLAAEGFGGGPGDYGHWFMQVRVAVPEARLYYAGMSPGVPGWRDWYVDDYVHHADGIAAHAYGTFDQMRQVVEALLPLGRPLWLAEVNFGAGQQVDRDAWARDHLRPFLDWCSTIDQVEAVTYFAYRWPTPDMSLPTPVDGAGTGIERVVREWRPPQEAPVADIALTVPNRLFHAAPENCEPGPRARTLGVVIHTTRSGGRAAAELAATINWFANPASGVSAHLVIGLPPFEEVVRCVHDDDIAWHCREANQTHLAIELCQPNAGDPITEFQYRAAAEACRLWATKYGFPLVRVFSQTVPGLVGHQDTEAGKRDRKSDPGPAFDWPTFIAMTGGTPVADDPTALRDQTYALADQLQQTGGRWIAAGYPQMAEYVRTAGEAIKRTVVIGKGEK